MSKKTKPAPRKTTKKTEKKSAAKSVPNVKSKQSKKDDRIIKIYDEVGELQSIAARHVIQSKAQYTKAQIKRDYCIKFLFLSDMHIPLLNTELFKHAIGNHLDADFVVTGSDFLDQYIVSSFLKERYIPLSFEFKMGVQFMKMLSESFKNIYVIKGNHDTRLSKTAGKLLDPSVMFATNHDILKKICEGWDIRDDGDFLPTHEMNNVHYRDDLCNWHLVIGRAAYSHYGGGGGFNAKNSAAQGSIAAFDVLRNRGIDVDAVFHGHTHQQSKIIRNGKMLIESGAMSLPMEYSGKQKAPMNAASYGYAVGYMSKDGYLDFNRSNFFHYGCDVFAAKPIDPEIACIDRRDHK